ncbi:uncharacterized protein J4E87_002904 [Alternaria ethzedia]|uniref:uncharacterized protein n=1 Tax=Alternaria ethzedia TaxID=181014 RepID=UPI0020C56FDF|nr:uncharacterized protein J4E87_002904 [Alternaria ethzedia]KAI4629718.1 hypothetical protein J4E87_002904 [Alternaria ethzedia]
MANSGRLPFDQSLFVATPNAIYLRSQLARKKLFECETANGIVNARASKDNSSLFAVADGQVVILHDATRSRDRKYKLKNGDGEPRLLLFSPDSRILYFTTTLSNSVQAYSIPNDELLPSLPSHPSPPSAIAISSNGTVLLSASPNPPTIYLQDQRWGRSAAVNFRPTDARSAATCAAFQQPDGPAQLSYTNFVIGFQDGLLAMYRLFLPSLRKRSEDSRVHQPQFFQLQPVRVGVIKKLHKPAMGAVEWVGDMTAPSLLPIRGSSLSPEPRPVVDIVGVEQPTSSDEGTGTVKKIASSHKQAVTRKSIPMRSPPDLFSDEPREPKSRVPSRRTSDVLRGSPLRVERARERPVKKALVRPRVSIETFESPPGPSSSGVPNAKVTQSSTGTDPPIQESRRWPRVYQAPNVRTPLRAHQFSASHRSASSSPESEFSDEDQEWFTPPSTRRCKGKAPRRDLSPEPSLTVPILASMSPTPFSKTSSTGLDPTNRNYSRPRPCIVEERSGRHQEAMAEGSRSSVVVPKAAGRHVTILDPELSSPFDSPSSLYSRATASMLERLPVGKTEEHGADQRPALPAGPKTPVLKPALVNVDPDPVLSSSVCSSSTPTTSGTKVTASDQRFIDIAGSSMLKTTPYTPPSREVASIAECSSSSSLDIIYSLPCRPKAEIPFVQNHSPRNPATAIHRQLTPNSLDTRADSPSSVYSRSISGMTKEGNPVNAVIEDTDQYADVYQLAD